MFEKLRNAFINDPAPLSQFIKLIAALLAILVIIAALAISLYQYFHSGFKFDDELGDLSSWASFILATAVGFAGAYVAIRIADIATKAQETGNRLQDPEYEAAHKAALTIESLRASLATTLAFYRLYRNRREALFDEKSPLLPLLKAIREAILDSSWQGVVSGFCGDVSKSLQHDLDTTTARLLNSLHHVIEVRSDVNVEKHFYYALYQASKLGRTLAKAIENGKQQVGQLKGKSAYLLTWESQFNLSSLDVNSETRKLINGYYETLFKSYGAEPIEDDSVVNDDSVINDAIKKLQNNCDNNSWHGILYVYQEPGDSSAYDTIVDACIRVGCSVKENPDQLCIQDRVAGDQAKLDVYYCYQNIYGVLSYSDRLNNVVIIMDGFPDNIDWPEDDRKAFDKATSELMDDYGVSLENLMDYLRGRLEGKAKENVPNRILWVVLHTVPGYVDGLPKKPDEWEKGFGGFLERLAKADAKLLYVPID